MLQSIAGSCSPRRLLRDTCLGHHGGRLQSVTCCYLKWGLSKEAQLDIWHSGIPGPSAKESQEVIPCSLAVFIFTSRIVEAKKKIKIKIKKNSGSWRLSINP